MESPVSPLETRETDPYRGETETPVLVSLGALLAIFSVIVVALFVATDCAPAVLSEAACGSLIASVALVAWGLARSSTRLHWVIGVPTKRQVIAQVRRGMVMGGYLPHDMALWSPRPFKCRLNPRARTVEVSYTGALGKPPYDLGAYLLETRATNADDIATAVPWGGVKLVLTYGLDEEA